MYLIMYRAEFLLDFETIFFRRSLALCDATRKIENFAVYVSSCLVGIQRAASEALYLKWDCR